MTSRRPLALVAAGGPVVFASAWATLGAITDGYAATEDAISRLAAAGAPTQVPMTAAIVALGAGLVSFGVACRSKAGAAAIVSGVASFGVAALPLGSPARDAAHGVAASIGYASLAAVPLLAAPASRGGRRALAVAAGMTTAACLAATTLDVRNGLFQRAGLTVGHAWVVATAISMLRKPSAPSARR